MIEFINVSSKGKWISSLKKSKFKQVLLASFLGSIPGCMGGFASVSLYTHRIISFGALVAMLIATSGDEAFVMLAMFPGKAILLFVILFVLAVVTGLLIDRFYKKEYNLKVGDQEFSVHSEDNHTHDNRDDPKKEKKYFGLKRVVILLGVALFSTALLFGVLEHDHNHEESNDHHEEICQCEESESDHQHDQHLSDTHNHDHIADHQEVHSHNESEELGFDLLSERWMNIIFAVLSLITLFFLIKADNHFIEDHIWGHVIKKHLPNIFLWTFGALMVIGWGLQYIDIANWITDNTIVLIIIAALIGLIPESGPHLIFVTLFASGVAPFSVLLASSISQDGHAALPLLAESKKDFIKAKAINLIIAIIIGLILHLTTGL